MFPSSRVGDSLYQNCRKQAWCTIGQIILYLAHFSKENFVIEMELLTYTTSLNGKWFGAIEAENMIPWIKIEPGSKNCWNANLFFFVKNVICIVGWFNFKVIKLFCYTIIR